MSGQRRTVLLTGASGVVGRAIASELRDHRVIGLAHSDPTAGSAEEVVLGDISRPRFGLDAESWSALAKTVDVIVHSAALTEWGQPDERYRRINIDGTAHVAELAQAVDAPVHYVGTCFVRAIELGRVSELSDGNVVRPYIASKLRAEQVLADSGVRYSVYRPTNLVGDSRTGASFRPQIVQMMSQWICRGKAPFFPLHAGNPIDLLALDTTAMAIARAVEADDLGRIYWLTSGQDALKVDDALNVVLAHASSRGKPISAPPVLDPGAIDAAAWSRVSATSKAFIKVLIDVSEVTRACGGVLPSSLPELTSRYGLPAVSVAEAYRKSLEFWAGERASSRRTTEEFV
ncbi:male sterility protein [Nocardia tenerifensis]|uniref:Male sterility protein n=1 Tax=Nocardia tenerifensis TaxID=228006 RepID=A0A318JSC9_9NOCA|nr:male sterility protein [Nocardia tenerifensis]